MVDSWRLLAELVGLLGLSLALGLLARRLRQTAAIGYLLAGLLAGPKGLGIIQARETVDFLASLGVALLLFGIGLEFSWHRIAALGRRSVIAGLLQFGLTWLAGAAAGRWLGLSASGQLVLGNVLALSSTAFLLRILQERSEMDSRHGRLTFGVALLQDLLLIPLLVFQSISAQGRSELEGLADLSIQLVKGAALLALIYVVVRLVVLPIFRRADAYAEREAPVLLSVLVAVGCSWGSHVAGLSPVLGAFVGGVLLADQPVSAQVRANLAPFQAVFFTLFFASIGMLAGIPSSQQAPLVILASAGIIAVKFLMAALALRLTGCPPRVALMGGLALAQIGEFSFVLAKDALDRRLLPAGWFEPLVTASILTLILNPYLMRAGHWWANRWSRRQSRLGAAEPAEGPASESVIVVGFGPAGREVCRALEEAGVEPVVVESNPALAETAKGYPTVVGDGTSVETMVKAGIRTARMLIVTVPDPGTSRTILGVARDLNPDLRVVVRARYHRYAEPLRHLGAEAVVDEEHHVGRALADVARRRLGLTSGSS
ncbi:MAG: cation:proton antiporter [Bryobacteraceae bacterium]|nr:cation:proton antiporter [Bryobacteraceae bacterium]